MIANLRNAFLEIGKEYKVYTDEERKKVISVSFIVSLSDLRIIVNCIQESGSK